jgi:hypothetical protein
MKVRAEVVCLNAAGDERRRQVLTIERRELAMETLGMNLTEGKALLAGVQDFVVTQQAREELEQRRKERQLNRFEGSEQEWERQPLPDGPITVGIDGGYVRAANVVFCKPVGEPVQIAGKGAKLSDVFLSAILGNGHKVKIGPDIDSCCVGIDPF